MASDRDRIIEDIYEAVAFPERWPAILERIGRSADTPGIVLLTRRSDAWSGYAVSKPMEHDFLQYLATDIVTRSQTTGRLLQKDWSGFLSNLDLFSSEEWEQEPFRKEWGRKWGWNHAAATAIQIPSGDSLVVHVQRREGEDSFDRRSLAILDSFRPHVARAGLLATRWRMQQLTAAAEALALVGLPAAILDRSSRVLAANALMEDLKHHVRWLARDRMAMIDKAADQLLQRAMEELARAATPESQSFASRSAADAMVVHVIPAHGQARDLFDGGLSLVVATPVAPPEAPHASLIRGLFDLSGGEARVAQGLAAGRTVQEIAEGAGVSLATVRTQLRGVFAKTGMARQATLVGLLANLWRPPGSSGEGEGG